MWAATWACSREGRTRAERARMHISKEGEPYLWTLLVHGAQHILGPFGADALGKVGENEEQ